MNTWAYTDAEIGALYREAADKAHQITIIAELCNRPKTDVIDRLRALGFEIVTEARRRYCSTVAGNAWTAEETEALIRGYRAGRTAFEIQRMIKSRSCKAITSKAQKMGLAKELRRAER